MEITIAKMARHASVAWAGGKCDKIEKVSLGKLFSFLSLKQTTLLYPHKYWSILNFKVVGVIHVVHPWVAAMITSLMQTTTKHRNALLYSHFLRCTPLTCLTWFGLHIPQTELMIFHPNPHFSRCHYLCRRHFQLHRGPNQRVTQHAFFCLAA